MFRHRTRKHDDSDEDAWLITYADMVTLLLCFFIIMFSLSTPKGQQFVKIAKAMQGYDLKNGEFMEKPPAEDTLTKLKNELQLSLGASGYDKMIAVSKNDKFVSMELASDSFFESGSATFSQSATAALQLAAQQVLPLADKRIIIEVEGHTDDSPIATAKYPSNWELSGARSSSVVRYLIAQGFPKEKIHAVGYAETQPKAPNEDTAGKPIPANQGINRRVVIKLLKPDDETN